MIRLEMFGRLGNQMFRYAFARALQLKTGLPIRVSFHFVRIEADPKKTASFDQGWENSLQYFNVAPMEEYKEDKRLLFDSPDLFQKIVGFFYLAYRKIFLKLHLDIEGMWRVTRPWARLLNREGLFMLSNGYYDYDNLNRKEYYLDGCFENSKYFSGIRDVLLKEFTPKEKPLSQNKDLYTVLASRNSVCVSIRTFREIAEDDNQSSLYHAYEKEYYIKAMDYMRGKLENPLFLICSDDIDWVRQNIDMSGYDVIYETGNDPIWEKVRIMYSCKNFIMSNSTFSWWTMWLSRNEDKIVVAPKRWFNDRFQGYLIENWMIKI